MLLFSYFTCYDVYCCVCLYLVVVGCGFGFGGLLFGVVVLRSWFVFAAW